MDELVSWEGELEVRQFGGARTISGVFPYNRLGVVSDRGRVRKERIGPRAFEYAIAAENRKIDLLVGHDFGKPIASRQSGTMVIEDAADAVRFTATLPADPPSWVTDAEKAIRAGTMTGLSPGFRVPPRETVRNAEELLPEPGNPSVQIRQINHAVLREFSVVTAPTYDDAFIEMRAEDVNAVIFVPRSVFQWL